MEFANVIAQRHSTRHYLDSEPLSRQAVLELIGQAQQAPSWKNCQSTRYYVLTKPEAKADFAARCLPPFNAKNVEHAVALFVVTFAKEKSGYRLRAGEPNVPANELADMWGAYDAGLSSDHLLLAAKNGGYDSLVIGIRDADAIRAQLAIPEEEVILSVIALGKGEAEFSKPPRIPVEEQVVFRD